MKTLQTAEEILDQNEYIFQEGDTVNIDEGVIHQAMEVYANQRVIEELERLKSDCDAEDDAYSFAMSKAHQKRIKELKQD